MHACSVNSCLRPVRLYLSLLWPGLWLYLACGPAAPAESHTRARAAVEAPSDLFVSLPADQTGIQFINQVQDGEQFNVLTYRNYYNGGGVALGDVNNDGLPDIYFTANMGPNKLYLNKGNWQFEDITDRAGVAGTRAWSTGVTMADVNADGWLDIYVCNSGDVAGDNKENELFINQGNLTFTEQAAAYGLNNAGFSTHAAFFDYDLDGDLDCYVLNNSFKTPDRIELYRQAREEVDELGGDKLYRNDGGKFTDVTTQAGIYSSAIGFGLGVSVSDVNGDMLPDIYISNDFWERDYLYLNQGDGTFSEELTRRISLTSVSSMGADIADMNNDQFPEIFTTDMLPGDNYRLKTMTAFDPFHLEDLKYRSSYHFQMLQNCLQVNAGDGQFQEMGHLAGISATDWSWGALMFDFDKDGWKDIYVCNGIYHDIMYLDFTNFLGDKAAVKKVVTEKGRFDFRDFVPYIPSNPLSNFAFVNQRNLTFRNQATRLGLGTPSFSNGAAYGDLDNDGDYDLVVNNVNMPCFVYQNQADRLTRSHHLAIQFAGAGANPQGVGAQVEVKAGGQWQVLQHYPSRGFQSAVAPGLLFGLGEHTQVDSLRVIWPDRRTQVRTGIPADQPLTLRQAEADARWSPARPSAPPVMALVPDLFPDSCRHTENIHNDFNTEILLPHALSAEGPRLITGDINGDGLTDFVLPGTRDVADKLYVQQPDGRFKGSTPPAFEAQKGPETTCGQLFDADQDGDLDLLLGAGGNELKGGIEAYLLRYFENDGSGQFIHVPEKTPPAAGFFSCIVADDFDQDGDPDLFIGGRAVPGNYGLKPASFLFRNDRGTWTPVTPPYLGGIGMVTDAVWAHTDADTLKDLVVVGEWLPVLIFKNTGKSLEAPRAIPQSEGWWTRVVAADLDRDGRTDFVLGNWGLNSRYQATPDRPLSLYVKDFDANGKSDILMTWYPPLDTVAYPFASKPDLTAQIPSLRRKILNFEPYGHMTYEQLFTAEERKEAVTWHTRTLASAILWQNPGGFTLEALPLPAQVAPTFGIVADDVDGDGHTDILLGGNFYGLKPEAGRHDDHRGLLLRGTGQRTFAAVPPAAAGLYLRGEVRDIQAIRSPGTPALYLIGINNQPVQGWRATAPMRQ
ncbi:MAG: VCBS repeat-containing protein [Bacteroidia bacterium]|nr:VCBS repeat-containing protein [Bacteroidia bacterium]